MMKTENELNDMILAIKNKINGVNPELLKYLDEMPVTIPTKENPEINAKTLQSYYDSLVEMYEEYEENKSENVNPEKGIRL